MADNLVNFNSNISMSNTACGYDGYLCSQCNTWVSPEVGHFGHCCITYYPYIYPNIYSPTYIWPYNLDETVEHMLERHKNELKAKLEKVKLMQKEVESIHKLEKAIKLLE